MRPLTFLILLIVFAGCTEKEVNYQYNSPVYQHLQNVGQDQREKEYSDLKNRILHKQQLFSEEYTRSGSDHQNNLIALSGNYLLSTLSDTLFPFWYHTRWDYNGTTETPCKGKIACGYFVTTTLKHAGFNLNRVKLAQQASSKIIKTLCGNPHIIGHNDLDQLEKYILAQKDGIFIIGLDNHVGFLHKKDSSVHMVHSNGVAGSVEVVREPMRKSKLIKRSQAFYIGSLLGNKKTLEKWIRKEAFPVSA